jgi:hypothetical protein
MVAVELWDSPSEAIPTLKKASAQMNFTNPFVMKRVY